MADLPKKRLGRTGLDVTVLGFGALEVRDVVDGIGRALQPGEAERILNAVLDAGINYIDTAVDYGRSEENIGRYISHRRKEFFLASKCGCPPDVTKYVNNERTMFGVPLPKFHVYDAKMMRAGVEQSLRRMKTDYLDGVQLHFGPNREQMEREGTVKALQDLKREGKVRFIGCSSTLPNLWEHIPMGVFDVYQIPYSALQRDCEAAITAAAKSGAGIVIRGGVARGEPGEGQGFQNVWQMWEKAKLDELLDGMTPTEFMLRFTIAHPDMHTTIVGTLRPEHLQENIKALLMGPLPADVVTETKRRLMAAGAPEPVRE